MEAVVLAGGLGMRLRGRVPHLPKPMAPVRGRPFLEFVLARLELGGVDRVVLCVGHLGQVIVDHFGDHWGGLEVVYSAEEQPLGTGGAVKQALDLIEGGDFLVANGDTAVPVDVSGLRAAEALATTGLTMTLSQVEDVERFGAAVVQGELVRDLTEKGARGPGMVNAGVYLVAEPLRSELRRCPDVFSFEQAVLEPWVRSHGAGYVLTTGPFLDIGVPVDYERAAEVLAMS